ncbi:MAG TPA: hypothetical protein VF068_13755 [Rubrobacter sp.]
MIIVAGHLVTDPEQRDSYLAGCVSVVEQARRAAARIDVFERWELREAVEAFRGGALLSASVAEYDVAGTRSLTGPSRAHPRMGTAPAGEPGGAGATSSEQQTFAGEGIEGIVLRYGQFYAPDTFSDLFVDLMCRRRLAVPRGGRVTICWVHIKNAASATAAALELGQPGQTYNVVDDEPVNWRDLSWTLAEAPGTPRSLELPRWCSGSSPLPWSS